MTLNLLRTAVPRQEGDHYFGQDPWHENEFVLGLSDNMVENNNNPNVSVEGTAGLGPTGTG